MPQWTSETAPRLWSATAKYARFSSWNLLIQMMEPKNILGMAMLGKGSKLAGHLVVHLDATGSKQLEYMHADLETLQHIGRKKVMKDALQEVGEYIVKDVIPEYFTAEGTPTHPWQALAQSTVDWRINNYGNADNILMASWGLYKAITDPEQAIEEVVTGENARVVIGGKYFNYPEIHKYYTHMMGSYSKLYKAPIPARPFIPEDEKDFTREQRETMKQIFEKHIKKQLHGV